MIYKNRVFLFTPKKDSSDWGEDVIISVKEDFLRSRKRTCEFEGD